MVALVTFPRQSGELNLWIFGATALLGVAAGDNMAHTFGLASGVGTLESDAQSEVSEGLWQGPV